MILRIFLISLFIGLFQQSASAQNADLVTSFTMEACGLNYTQGSVRLNKRPFVFSPQTGVSQPATLTIANLPVCAVVLKAFLYVGISGTGAPFTASITNPASTNANFLMNPIGSDVDVCWSFGGTHTYRSDITSIINGNGSYVLSGIPTSSIASLGYSDADGATIFIVYQDPAQGYTGGIVMADGCKAVTLSSPQYASVTINNFSVCGTPTLTEHFALIGDLQQLGNTLFCFNAPSTLSTSVNYNKSFMTDKVWDFVAGQPNPFVSGQSSANYGVYNLGTDCFFLALFGSYYRTDCLTCLGTSGVVNPVITLTAVATASCTSTITVNVSGGLQPYTYTWTGGVSTTSIGTGLPSGQYNIQVAGAAGCGTGSTTIEITSLAPPAMATSTTVCIGQSATLTAFGGDTYSWSGPNNYSFSGASAPVFGTNVAGTMVYTATVGNSYNCTATVTATLNTIGDPTVSASATKTLICKGTSVTLTPTGATTYTWLASGLTGSIPIVVTPTGSTVYSVSGTNSNGCKNAGTILINVSECTGIGEQISDPSFISISPNPSAGEVTLRSQSPTIFHLINQVGQLISVIELNADNRYSTSVSGLAMGIYYFVEQGGSGKSHKVVVK